MSPVTSGRNDNPDYLIVIPSAAACPAGAVAAGDRGQTPWFNDYRNQ